MITQVVLSQHLVRAVDDRTERVGRVNSESINSIAPPQSAIMRFLTRTSIFLLLFTVAGLSTLAKNGQYFPQTNPARHVSISTKMNVAHSPVIFTADQLQTAAKVSPRQRPIQFARVEKLPDPPIRHIGLTVSMQFRSPPVILS